MGEARLLSGDNPQVEKGYGDERVAAFLDAVPDDGPGGWKNAVCREIDGVVTREVPGVHKAVKWNSPMYAAPDAETRNHFFLVMHCFTKYVKVTFTTGDNLSPPPPVESKIGTVRYFHVEAIEDLDAQFADWVRQAAALPGVKM